MIYNHPSVDMKAVEISGSTYLLNWKGINLTAIDVTTPAAPTVKFEDKLVDDDSKFEYIRDIYVSGTKVFATLVVRNRKEYDGFVVWSRYPNMTYTFDAVIVEITDLFA